MNENDATTEVRVGVDTAVSARVLCKSARGDGCPLRLATDRPSLTATDKKDGFYVSCHFEDFGRSPMNKDDERVSYRRCIPLHSYHGTSPVNH